MGVNPTQEKTQRLLSKFGKFGKKGKNVRITFVEDVMLRRDSGGPISTKCGLI